MTEMVGIVGNGSDKFVPVQEVAIKKSIRQILKSQPIFRSGHSKLEGIDIWSEEIARELGCAMEIQAPQTEDWSDFQCCKTCLSDHQGKTNRYHKCECTCHFPVLRGDVELLTLVGYRSRNLKIAEADEVHVYLSTKYPDNYQGQKFDACYHCKGASSPWQHPWHIKSGACWTGLQAHKNGSTVIFHFVSPDGTIKTIIHRGIL